MKILSARQFNSNLKVTVQQTGKMNFTDETAKALALTASKGVKFFLDGEGDQLYMTIMAYYYVAAQLMFDELGVDYKTYTVIYDLVRCKSYDEKSGGQCFRMDCRPIKKKKDKDKDKDDGNTE